MRYRFSLGRLMLIPLAATAACHAPGMDDHGEEATTFEGDSISSGLDAQGVSRVVTAAAPFERLGVLWDAPTGARFELRTSPDRKTWSKWTAPETFFSEEGAHAGRVEVEGVAQFYQYRLVGAPPSFVSFQPIESVARIPDEPVMDALDEEEATAEELPLAEGEDGVGVSGAGLSTRIGSVNVNSRRSWGARSPRCALDRHTPNRITIHHTVGPINDSLSPQARLRQIQSFHMFGNGWCDIGYNFIVSRDGRIWRGRGSGRVGAHTENANTGNIGISFIGTYTSTPITSKQKCNAAKLMRYLGDRFSGVSLNRSDVKGHRQFGSTACPGDRLYRQLDSLVSTARNGCN